MASADNPAAMTGVGAGSIRQDFISGVKYFSVGIICELYVIPSLHSGFSISSTSSYVLHCFYSRYNCLSLHIVHAQLFHFYSQEITPLSASCNSDASDIGLVDTFHMVLARTRQ